MKFEEAEDFFAHVFKGKHHIPGKLKECGSGWMVYMWGHLSTWDDNYLTRLVLAAHDWHVRVQIDPAMRYLRLAVHDRVRDGGDYPIMNGHPTIGDAITMWRENGMNEEKE